MRLRLTGSAGAPTVEVRVKKTSSAGEEMMHRILAGVVVALALVAGTGTGTQAKEWTKIRWGVEGAYPPFSEVGTDGQIKGFDIDIEAALCKQMKVQCQLVQQDW